MSMKHQARVRKCHCGFSLTGTAADLREHAKACGTRTIEERKPAGNPIVAALPFMGAMGIIGSVMRRVRRKAA